MTNALLQKLQLSSHFIILYGFRKIRDCSTGIVSQTIDFQNALLKEKSSSRHRWGVEEGGGAGGGRPVEEGAGSGIPKVAGSGRKREKFAQHYAIFRNRKNAKRQEPTNTVRELGLKGTGSGRV